MGLFHATPTCFPGAETPLLQGQLRRRLLQAVWLPSLQGPFCWDCGCHLLFRLRFRAPESPPPPGTGALHRILALLPERVWPVSHGMPPRDGLSLGDEKYCVRRDSPPLPTRARMPRAGYLRGLWAHSKPQSLHGQERGRSKPREPGMYRLPGPFTPEPFLPLN